MATADSSLASVDLDDLLECPVCLERLDVSSKVLPCQHVFCRRCLEKWAHTTHKELTCPECRVRVSLSIDELPSNILLNRILERVCQISQTLNKEGNDRKGSNRRRHQHKHGFMPLDPNFYPGVHARALYSYQPEKRRQELPLAAGDVIVLLRHIHRSWYQAESRGLRGLVPTNYVQILSEEEEKNLPSFFVPRRYVARFEFQRDSDAFGSYLNFGPGDLLELIRQIDENWALGQMGSRQALFPISFVEEVLESCSISSSSDTPNGNLIAHDSTTSHDQMPLAKMHSSLPLVAQVPALPCDRRSTIVKGSSVDWIMGQSNNPASTRPPPPTLSRQHAPLRRHQHTELLSSQEKFRVNGNEAIGIAVSCSRDRDNHLVRPLAAYSEPHLSNNFVINRWQTSDDLQHSDSTVATAATTATTSQNGTTTEPSYTTKKRWVERPHLVSHSLSSTRQRPSFLSRLQSVFSSTSCASGTSNQQQPASVTSASANAVRHEPPHHPTTTAPSHAISLTSKVAATEETVPPLVHTRSSRRGSSERPHSMFALNSIRLPSYRCVVPYPAASESELTLHYGDIIFVSETRQDGWCRGRLQRSGRDGLFPSTFVQPLQ